MPQLQNLGFGNKSCVVSLDFPGIFVAKKGIARRTMRIKHLDGNKLDFSLKIGFLVENGLCLASGRAEVKGHHSRWIPLNENTGKMGSRAQNSLRSLGADKNSQATAQKMPHPKLISVLFPNSSMSLLFSRDVPSGSFSSPSQRCCPGCVGSHSGISLELSAALIHWLEFILFLVNPSSPTSGTQSPIFRGEMEPLISPCRRGFPGFQAGPFAWLLSIKIWEHQQMDRGGGEGLRFSIAGIKY